MRQCISPESIAVNGFAKASTLINWLLERVKPLNYEYNTNTNDPEELNKWNERGKAIEVAEFNKVNYLNCIRNDFRVIRKNVDMIHTYKDYPLNLFPLMCTIVFFPVDMHYDLLVIFRDTLYCKMSPNCRKSVLVYYYNIATNPDKKKFLKHPKYLESVLNNKFNTNFDNKYEFVYENDASQSKRNGEEVEIIDDECDMINNPKEVVRKFIKNYGNIFGEPNI